MTPSEEARVQECVKELSEILYRNTPSDKSIAVGKFQGRNGIGVR